jgi:hypothetical protein
VNTALAQMNRTRPRSGMGATSKLPSQPSIGLGPRIPRYRSILDVPENMLGFRLADLVRANTGGWASGSVPMLHGQRFKGRDYMPIGDAIAELGKATGLPSDQVGIQLARLSRGGMPGSAALGGEAAASKAAQFTDPRRAHAEWQKRDPAGAVFRAAKPVVEKLEKGWDWLVDAAGTANTYNPVFSVPKMANRALARLANDPKFTKRVDDMNQSIDAAARSTGRFTAQAAPWVVGSIVAPEVTAPLGQAMLAHSASKDVAGIPRWIQTGQPPEGGLLESLAQSGRFFHPGEIDPWTDQPITREQQMDAGLSILQNAAQLHGALSRAKPKSGTARGSEPTAGGFRGQTGEPGLARKVGGAAQGAPPSGYFSHEEAQFVGRHWRWASHDLLGDEELRRAIVRRRGIQDKVNHEGLRTQLHASVNAGSPHAFVDRDLREAWHLGLRDSDIVPGLDSPPGSSSQSPPETFGAGKAKGGSQSGASSFLDSLGKERKKKFLDHLRQNSVIAMAYHRWAEGPIGSREYNRIADADRRIGPDGTYDFPHHSGQVRFVNGQIDSTPHAIQESRIRLTGDRDADFRAANKAFKLPKSKDTVIHHDHRRGPMQEVPAQVNKPGHSGSFAYDKWLFEVYVRQLMNRRGR